MKKQDIVGIGLAIANFFAGRYASAAAGVAKHWKTIVGAIFSFLFVIVILISLLISLPGIIMQSWLPSEKHYEELAVFATDEIDHAENQKKSFIQWVLDSLSEKDDDGKKTAATMSGTEPSSDEIQILYAVKYGYEEYMTGEGLNPERLQVVTDAFLKRSFLHLELLPFSEAVERVGLTEEEKLIALNMYDNYMYDQIITNGDGIDLAGVIDYGSITFRDGSTNVVYFNQRDKRWSSLAYGDGTIGGAGCGPTSLAMAISSLTSMTATPVEVCNWAASNGYKSKGGGSYWSLIPAAAKYYGLQVQGDVREAQELVDALSDGKLVIAIMGKGHFTSRGHFLLLRGVTADGKILVADSASTKKSNMEWDLNLILKEVKKGSSSGGPFWILSK